MAGDAAGDAVPGAGGLQGSGVTVVTILIAAVAMLFGGLPLAAVLMALSGFLLLGVLVLMPGVGEDIAAERAEANGLPEPPTHRGARTREKGREDG
jgi:hypothetical protein